MEQERTNQHWQCGSRLLPVGERPLLMGILNVTPDSFSDGGRYNRHDAAVRHALAMDEAGADIIDVGGESTRPGAAEVSAEEEAARVVPVIRDLRTRCRAALSVDTMKAQVARRALDAGADIINDVSALTHDESMAALAAECGCGVVLMHMQGTPRTMQNAPHYGDVVGEVRDFLAARADRAIAAGVRRAAIAVDPGIGFGKTVAHNLRLLAAVDRLAALGYPVLIGLSRKSFIGKLSTATVEQRLPGSLAGLTAAILQGAHILRVHDVAESKQAALVAAAIQREREA